MYFTPDHTHVLNLLPDAKLKIYEVKSDYTDLIYLNIFTGCVSPVTDGAYTLAFSDDSSLVIIETDNVNPITVLSLVNYTVVGSYAFPGVITRTAFITGSNQILVVAASDLYLIDMGTGVRTLLDNMGLTPTTTMFDQVGNFLYVCSNNAISAVEINATLIVASNSTSNSSSNTTTNSTSNTTTNSTSNTTNSTTNTTTNATANTTTNSTSNSTTNATSNSSTSNTTLVPPWSPSSSPSNTTTTNSSSTAVHNEEIIEITMSEDQSTVTKMIVKGLTTTNSLL